MRWGTLLWVALAACQPALGPADGGAVDAGRDAGDSGEVDAGAPHADSGLPSATALAFTSVGVDVVLPWGTGVGAFGSRVLLLSEGPSAGCFLWISDGTDAGTTALARVGPDACAWGARFPSFASTATRGYVAVPGSGLWETDGTPAGTRVVNPTVRAVKSTTGGAVFASLGSGAAEVDPGTGSLRPIPIGVDALSAVSDGVQAFLGGPDGIWSLADGGFQVAGLPALRGPLVLSGKLLLFRDTAFLSNLVWFDVQSGDAGTVAFTGDAFQELAAPFSLGDETLIARRVADADAGTRSQVCAVDSNAQGRVLADGMAVGPWVGAFGDEAATWSLLDGGDLGLRFIRLDGGWRDLSAFPASQTLGSVQSSGQLGGIRWFSVTGPDQSFDGRTISDSYLSDGTAAGTFRLGASASVIAVAALGDAGVFFDGVTLSRVDPSTGNVGPLRVLARKTPPPLVAFDGGLLVASVDALGVSASWLASEAVAPTPLLRSSMGTLAPMTEIAPRRLGTVGDWVTCGGVATLSDDQVQLVTDGTLPGSWTTSLPRDGTVLWAGAGAIVVVFWSGAQSAVVRVFRDGGMAEVNATELPFSGPYHRVGARILGATSSASWDPAAGRSEAIRFEGGATPGSASLIAEDGRRALLSDNVGSAPEWWITDGLVARRAGSPASVNGFNGRGWLAGDEAFASSVDGAGGLVLNHLQLDGGSREAWVIPTNTVNTLQLSSVGGVVFMTEGQNLLRYDPRTGTRQTLLYGLRSMKLSQSTDGSDVLVVTAVDPVEGARVYVVRPSSEELFVLQEQAVRVVASGASLSGWVADALGWRLYRWRLPSAP